MKSRHLLILLLFAAMISYHVPTHGQNSDDYNNFYESNVVNTFKNSPDFNNRFSIDKTFNNGTIQFSESVLEKDLLSSIGLDKESSFTNTHEATSMLNEEVTTKRFEQYYKGIKVNGGGYALYLNKRSGTERVSSFTPYIFYDIDVNITPKIGDSEILELLNPDNKHFTKELIIDHHYRKDYTLCYYVEFSNEGEPYMAWVDANSGEIYEKLEAHIHLQGNTPTYGTQTLIDNTVGTTTFLESPSQDIRIYEGLNPSFPLVVAEWDPLLIPSTTNTVSWGTDATPGSQQSLHVATEAIPVYASQAGINFGNVHIAANNVANAFAIGGNVSTDAYITLGDFFGSPLSIYDVVAHELGHVYIWTFLQYTTLGNRSLHEGFSDVFGTYVESFIQTSGVDWVMGDDEPAVAAAVGRDLANPVCLTTIGGGGHTRGLIAGHWFYTLSTGNSSIDVSALGMPTVIALIKDAFALIPATSDYAEFSDATLTVAAQNWGCGSDEYKSVVNAWDHVCVTVDECSPCAAPDMIISSNTTISSDMIAGGHIIVEPGVQLTVTAKIEFLEGKALVVRQGAKLDLNGGHLTRCSTVPHWRGVVVEGFSGQSQPDAFDPPAVGQAGIVLVRNNSLIDWARTAISTNYWGGWTSQKWGGLVHVENSDFYNNRRVAEFMKYVPTNKSKFINVTMDGNSTISGTTVGVTIWDTDGITFNNCRFYNMESQGLLTYDAGANVIDGNDFMYNNKGISNRATYPYGANLVVGQNGTDPNYFYENWFHIESYATDRLSGLIIRNNEFFDANSAIWIVGPSKYLIENNSLANSTGGVVSLHAGSMNANQHNFVRFNGFNTSSGVTAYGRNRELQVLCNQFVNNWDIRVTETNNGSDPGEIRLFQGTLFSPADNCLTRPVTVADISTNGSTVHFNYYHSAKQKCKVPANPGNYTAIQSNFAGCGKLPPFQTPSYDEWIAVLENIAEHESNDDVKSDKYYALLEQRDAMLTYFVEKALKDSNSDEAISYLDQANTAHSKMAKFGIYMSNGNLENAEELLQSFDAEDPEYNEFIQVQKINISRLQNLEGFELSASQKGVLEELSESDSGVKAYARSILGLLEDKEYIDEYFIEGGGGGKVAETEEGQKISLTISPNPTSDRLTINLTSIAEIDDHTIEIVDNTGQLKYSNTINSKRSLEIDIEDYNQGIYVLRIVNDKNEVLFVEKVVKL